MEEKHPLGFFHSPAMAVGESKEAKRIATLTLENELVLHDVLFFNEHPNELIGVVSACAKTLSKS